MGGASDLDALQGDFRARAVLLGLVLVGGLGAAIWSGTREVGVGEPESRGRLMVVAGDAGINYYKVLERGGFEIEVEGYDEWLARAAKALPDSEAEGLALLLEHADWQGFGYLVLEQPGDYALASLGLELEPDPAEIEELGAREFAVLSVGDLAFPHHLSVDEPGSNPLVRLPGFAALEAVFGQPSLLARDDPERPTVDELQHEDAIELGQRMLGRPAKFATKIAEAEAALADSLAVDAGVHTLAPASSAGSAVPLPNGGVLVVHHGLEAYSRDGSRLELHADETMRLDYLDRAGLDARMAGQPLVLTPCSSLAGGALDLQDRPKLEAAVDGSAMLISTDSGPASLWQLEAGEGCSWRLLGEVEAEVDDGHRPVGRNRSVVVPAARRRLLVVAPTQLAPGLSSADSPGLALTEFGVDEDEGELWLRAWSPPEAEAGLGEAPDRALVEAELMRVPGGSTGSAAFIDRDHLALLASAPVLAGEGTSPGLAEDALYFVDRRAPGAYLRVPTSFFAEGVSLHEVELLDPPRPNKKGEGEGEGEGEVHGPCLVLTASRGGASTELLVLEIGGEAWAEFDAGAPSEGAGLYTLTPEDLASEWIAAGDQRLRVGLDARAGLVAFSERGAGELDGELFVIRPGSASGSTGAVELRRLTDNALADRLARIGPEGRVLVFSTVVRSSLSTRAYSVPRVVALDELAPQ